MAKSAIPATIGIAAFQSTSWALHFGPLNYLVAIEALLSYCILPRARFMQLLFLNVLMTCLAAAINLFALWCAIKARTQTTAPGASLSGYNSSASAVLAIWFMVQIYLVNALRSSRPQFSFPCINYCIFTSIAIVQAGPDYGTIQEAEAFTALLLEAHLTGYALAAGVSILILPHSNRVIAISTTAKYIDALRKLLSAYRETIIQCDHETSGDEHMDFKNLTDIFAKLRAVDTELKGQLDFALREIGYGRLTGQDLEQCYKHLRDIYLPILGLRDLAEDVSGSQIKASCKCYNGNSQLTPTWKPQGHVAKPSNDLIYTMSQALNDIQQCLLVEVQPRKRLVTNSDPEKSNTTSIISHVPILKDFASTLLLCTDPDTSERANMALEGDNICDACKHRLKQQVLIEQRTQFVLYHSSKAVIRLLEFVEAKTESTSFQRKHLILPSWGTLSKWWFQMFKNPEIIDHSHFSNLLDHEHSSSINAFSRKGHRNLSARPRLRFLAKHMRAIPHLLRSPHSRFGFRAMCASMSIGIISYLKNSHDFFVQQRLIWAIIMTAIAMKTTAGHATFDFLLRILASVVGTVGSFVIWYIVDGKPAGTIVFMYLYMAASFYFGVVKPKYVVLALVSSVTPLISVGYALNIHKLGPTYLHEANTPTYPLYRIAAYRLVNVIGGLAVAYIWTVFPFPVTEISVIRHNMGSCVFLLARYNAIISETLLTRDRLNFSETQAEDLRQTRLDTLHQAQAHLVNLKTLSAYTKWQVSIDVELYQVHLNDLVNVLDRITSHIAIFGFASSSLLFSGNTSEDVEGHFTRLEALVSSLHKVTSVLCLMSASITNDLPLPPYLFLSEAFEDVSASHGMLDDDASSSSTESSMNSRAVAVIHVAARKAQLDMERMAHLVKAVCGELDFSAKALSSDLEPQVSYEAGEKRRD